MESDLSNIDEIESVVDARADRVVDLIEECIEAASISSHNFVAVKLTALGNTNALLNVSTALSYLWDGFKYYSNGRGYITGSELFRLLESLPGYSKEQTISLAGQVTWNNI